MRNYRDVIIREFGVNPDQGQGTGAAGGLGTALLVFLHAQMRSGIETVLDLIRFDQTLENADLVVTGEGRTDWQSCFGKVMWRPRGGLRENLRARHRIHPHHHGRSHAPVGSHGAGRGAVLPRRGPAVPNAPRGRAPGRMSARMQN